MSKLRLPPEMKHRTFRFDVKAVDDEQGLIEAYGSIFNNVDDGDDTVKPGAFKRTIQNSKTRVQDGKAKFLAVMLYQHDANKPIGGWTDMKEDSTGLLCKGQIVLSTQLGKETYELIKAGIINQFSIGYDIPSGGAVYDKSTGVRNLTEIRLWEISVVTFAMNQEALLVGVKNKKGKTMETKDFDTLFKVAQQADCMEDWGDLLNTLSQTMIQIFGMSDSPRPDMAACLSQFGSAVEDWQAKAVECDLGGYINDQGYCSPTSTPYVPYSVQVGSSYMSRPANSLQGKAGAAISASNQEKIDNHVAAIKSMATQFKSAVHSQADDFASIMQGAEPTYAAPNAGTPDEQEGKATSYFDTRRSQKHSSQSGDTAEEDELSSALASLELLKLS